MVKDVTCPKVSASALENKEIPPTGVLHIGKQGVDINDNTLTPRPVHLFKDNFPYDIVFCFRFCQIHKLYPFHLILGF